MSPAELDRIMARWISGGLSAINEQERQACKAIYLGLLGNPPGCTSCPDFWHDCKMGLRDYLKKQGFTMKMPNHKYRLRKNSGSLRVPYFNEHYTNETLTNEAAERILKARPEYLGVLIVLNPDYVEPQPANEVTESEPVTTAEAGAEQAEASADIAQDAEPEAIAEPAPVKPARSSRSRSKAKAAPELVAELVAAPAEPVTEATVDASTVSTVTTAE